MSSIFTSGLSGEKQKLYEMLLEEEGVRIPPQLKIPRRNENLPVPLSFAQQRLWLLDQIEPSVAYNVPAVKRLLGDLNLSVLESSLKEIIRRHESLRTSFPYRTGQPWQVIAEPGEWKMAQFDLSHLAADEREHEAKRLITVEGVHAPFVLARGPLLRATLLKLAEQDHVLFLNLHHIISDGWSLGLLFKELAVLYNAHLRGHESPLPELPIQYADYAVWQRDYLQGEVLEQQLEYWKQQLSGAPAVSELPTDHPRLPNQNRDGAGETFTLSKELTERLKTLSQREGATLFMTMLAAFQVLLSRYSGQEDVVVGTSIAGRNRKETESLIGFFVNTLVMRTDLSGSPSFREVLRRVSKTALDAYAHQDIPFQKLVEEIQPERSLSRHPLFEVFFSLNNASSETLQMDGLQFGAQDFKIETTQFDLMLTLTLGSKGFVATFWYSTALFDEGTIKRMVGHFRRLLRAVVEEPAKGIRELRLLEGEERRLMLVEWNQTAVEYPEDQCVQELFEAQVERTPEAVAVIFGEQRLSYRELNERANRLAHYLRGQGVGPETLVGVFMERSPELVISLLAVLKAGGAYLPLDGQYSTGRLSYMLEDGAVQVLLTQERLLAELPVFWGQSLCVDTQWDSLSEMSSDNPGSRVRPHNLAYVIYTSGSTGPPKGVMVEHASLVNYLSWALGRYGVSGGEGAPVHSSISFDLTVTTMYVPLLRGQAVHLMAEGGAGTSVTALSEALAASPGYGLVKLTPAHLQVLERTMGSAQASGVTRCLVIGGEQLSLAAVQWWREYAPGTRLYNEYGPTETTVGCCVQEVTEVGGGSGAAPIGRPIANTQLYVLDEDGEAVWIGVSGELYIGGLGVGRGYLGDGGLTAERFVPDRFSGKSGGRLYRTGDVARYGADGVLECLGRVDQQLKVRGFRIELGEVETALSGHAEVREAVVLAAGEKGEPPRLVAYVVKEAGQDLRTEDLREWVKEKLPEYMIPSAFVIIEAMPLTENGKVDRQALLALAQVPNEIGESYSAPATAVEEMLCKIWTDVLKIERVGIDDNFFNLGGHSLLATMVITRMQEACGVEISLRAFFGSPTIAELAKVLVDQILEIEGAENVLRLLDQMELAT